MEYRIEHKQVERSYQTFERRANRVNKPEQVPLIPDQINESLKPKKAIIIPNSNPYSNIAVNEEEKKNSDEPIFDYIIEDNNELNYIRNIKKMYHK